MRNWNQIYEEKDAELTQLRDENEGLKAHNATLIEESNRFYTESKQLKQRVERLKVIHRKLLADKVVYEQIPRHLISEITLELEDK